MVVNSINFLLFFLIVFIVYYLPLNGKTRLQNLWLLVGSYCFYGFAEWKMLPLLAITTLFFYGMGILIGKYRKINTKKALFLTTLGTITGIGILLYFKYLNFFIESFCHFFNSIGFSVHWPVFNILIPLGISFFTFKLISYIIEIHRGHLEPCRNLIEFGTYISFFPTILSGPIDQPQPFISQLQTGRTFDYNQVSTGLKRILWGMFMKMCVADRLAIYLDAIFNNIPYHNGTTLAVGTLLYPIQIYADFCGYSEMAIGVGNLLGLKVTENFKRPFFSQNIAEYWRKWHISLTGWLTDYVFMPLNIRFRNMEKWGSIFAIIITFILIGLWHGAAWTFILFGLYHGLLYIPLMLSGSFFKKKKLKKNKYGLPTFRYRIKMLETFLLVAIGLILFRVTDIRDVVVIAEKIFSHWGALYIHQTSLFFSVAEIIILFLKDFKDEYWPNKHYFFESKYMAIRYLSFLFIVCFIILFGVLGGGQFIYFQF